MAYSISSLLYAGLRFTKTAPMRAAAIMVRTIPGYSDSTFQHDHLFLSQEQSDQLPIGLSERNQIGCNLNHLLTYLGLNPPASHSHAHNQGVPVLVPHYRNPPTCISGKGYTPLSRVLVTIGNYNPPPPVFAGFLGKSSRDYGKKYPPPPHCRKMEYACMRPPHIHSSGGRVKFPL